MNRLLHLLLLLTMINVWSCRFRNARDTPNEFLNEAKPGQAIYNKDKATLDKQFQKFLSTHDQSFYSKEYFDSTVLIIDTILYSEDKSRIAIFVFTKNPISRQLNPDKKDKWYYNAYCYLGKRQTDSFDLRWLNRFNLVNFYDQQAVTKRFREMYFKEFAIWKNTDNIYRYGVNLDDKRFWNCFAWEEYYRQ